MSGPKLTPEQEAFVADDSIRVLPTDQQDSASEQLSTHLQREELKDAIAHAREQSGLDRLEKMLASLGTEDERSQPRKLDDFAYQHPEKDPTCLLGNGLLYRGGNGFLGAETGIGKSNISVGAMVHWAAGLPFMGIPVGGMYQTQGLRILYIQAENQESDVAQQVESYLTLPELKPLRSMILDNTRCWTLNDAAGPVAFPARVNEVLDQLIKNEGFYPSLLIIDPLLSYAGCDISSSKDMSDFLRNAWLPVTDQRQIGAIWAHHANKPSKESAARDTTAYILGGSAELANFGRFVISVQKTASKHVVRLVGAKNVSYKVPWNENTEHYLAHVGGSLHMDDGSEAYRIAWRDATPEEIESANDNSGQTNVADRNAERSQARLRRLSLVEGYIRTQFLDKGIQHFHGDLEDLHEKVCAELWPTGEGAPKARRLQKDLGELRHWPEPTDENPDAVIDRIEGFSYGKRAQK